MKKKRVKIILMSVAGVLLLLAIFFFVSGNGNSDLRNHLFMGEKYLEDLDYEQALAEYKAVLEIDSENEDAIAGIETVSLLYTESLLVETNNVSVEELNGLLVVLEDSYQLTKAASVQEKVSEVKTVIEDKRAEEDRLAEEAKKLEEEKKKQEEEEKRKEELEKEIQDVEDLYPKILEWSNQVYKSEWKLYYWNTVYKITITDIEGNDYYELEVNVGPSVDEYYVYEINKNTLQGKLIRYYAEDFNGVFADEVYTDKPVIDFTKYTGENDEGIEPVGEYQLVFLDINGEVRRKKRFYRDYETGEYAWYEYGENEKLISEWSRVLIHDEDTGEDIEVWCLEEYTSDGLPKYSAYYDKEKNLIYENNYGGIRD